MRSMDGCEALSKTQFRSENKQNVELKFEHVKKKNVAELNKSNPTIRFDWPIADLNNTFWITIKNCLQLIIKR